MNSRCRHVDRLDHCSPAGRPTRHTTLHVNTPWMATSWGGEAKARARATLERSQSPAGPHAGPRASTGMCTPGAAGGRSLYSCQGRPAVAGPGGPPLIQPRGGKLLCITLSSRRRGAVRSAGGGLLPGCHLAGAPGPGRTRDTLFLYATILRPAHHSGSTVSTCCCCQGLRLPATRHQPTKLCPSPQPPTLFHTRAAARHMASQAHGQRWGMGGGHPPVTYLSILALLSSFPNGF